MNKQEQEAAYNELREECLDKLRQHMNVVAINSPPISADDLERYLFELKQLGAQHLLCI